MLRGASGSGSSAAFASESLAVAEGRGDAEQIIAMLQAISLIRIEQDRMADALAHQRDAIRLADPLDSKAIFSECCVPLVIAHPRPLRVAIRPDGFVVAWATFSNVP
jgi:hypothetical protein